MALAPAGSLPCLTRAATALAQQQDPKAEASSQAQAEQAKARADARKQADAEAAKQRRAERKAKATRTGRVSARILDDMLAGVILIDTAGRLHTKTGLMDELGKVKRVVEKKTPVDEVLLVIDATTGQNGLMQARVFKEVVDITGVVLTKLDGTAKGGIVVNVQRELGVPVVVADDRKTKPLVALTAPDRPTVVLSQPDAPPQTATGKVADAKPAPGPPKTLGGRDGVAKSPAPQGKAAEAAPSRPAAPTAAGANTPAPLDPATAAATGGKPVVIARERQGGIKLPGL